MLDAREVFHEQNRVRTNPQSYIPFLEQMLHQFKGMVLHKPGEIPLRTNEGPGAVQDCINHLRAQKPLHSLQWDDNMARAASDHSSDIGPKGITGHNGSDGSTMSSRLERYGDWMGKIAENIEFGSKTARDVVIALLIDDGNTNRGHRKSILSSDFIKAGVACCKHTQWDFCTVLNYAQEYTVKGGKSTGNHFTDNTPKFSVENTGGYTTNTFSVSPNQSHSSTYTQGTSNLPVNFEFLAREVFHEQNRVRQNPTSYIPLLEEYIKLFQGMVLRKPGDVPLRTHEGTAAVQDCINFLRNQKPLHALEWEDNMSRACKDHASDIGPRSICGHTGSDGSTMSSRLERYGDWSGKIGENCDFGNSTARDVIISLIVDDGVSNRGHRKNLFSQDFKRVGIACHSHQEYKTCTVLKYASEYGHKGSQSCYSTSVPTNTYNSYTSPYSNTTSNNTNTTYTTQNINDPYVQEQMKKHNVDSNIGGAYDPDKPANTIETSIQKNITITNGRKKIVETKTYKCSDGSQKISERTYYE